MNGLVEVFLRLVGMPSLHPDTAASTPVPPVFGMAFREQREVRGRGVPLHHAWFVVIENPSPLLVRLGLFSQFSRCQEQTQAERSRSWFPLQSFAEIRRGLGWPAEMDLGPASLKESLRVVRAGRDRQRRRPYDICPVVCRFRKRRSARRRSWNPRD